MSTHRVRLVIAAIAACALATLGLSSALARHVRDDAPAGAASGHEHHDHLSNTVAYSSLQQGTPSITVADQPLVNNTLVVAEVVALEDGWIAIHTVEAHDKPVLNQIVGTTTVKQGVNTNVQVKLTETFQPGDRLQVMLHVDHGTKGAFEFPSGADAAVRVNEQVLTKPISVLAAGAQAMLPDTGQAGRAVLRLAPLIMLLIVMGVAARRRVGRQER